MLFLRTKPTTNLVVPFQDKLSNRYIIEYNLFPKGQVGIETPVVDVSLMPVHVHCKLNQFCFYQLSCKVVEYLDLNDVIIYFYYDNKDNIPRRDKSISPQLYRSRLFNCLIKKYCPKEYIVKNIEIEDDLRGNHYITLISSERNIDDLNQIYSEVYKLNKD